MTFILKCQQALPLHVTEVEFLAQCHDARCNDMGFGWGCNGFEFRTQCLDNIVSPERVHSKSPIP